MPGEIVLSFDNLGEAADEERGRPVELPPPSVTSVLPRVLALLGEAGLHATFFVEAINVERHPQALGAIVAGGHELGCHGWRHEIWHALTPAARTDVLRRSLAAARSLGTEVTGFRPPGGILEDGDFARVADEGIAWVSPAGRQAGVHGGVACLPFAWREIDAYYFAEALAPLRLGDGAPEAPLEPEDFARAAAGAIDEALGTGEPLVLVLHPYLYSTQARFAVLADLVRTLGRLAASGAASVGPGREAAERVLERADARAPVLDISTWS